jgi:hypothetical protein
MTRSIKEGVRMEAVGMRRKIIHTLAYYVCIFTLCLCISTDAEDVGSKFASFAGFELGTVTLADVQKRLGATELVETGDAGEYTASVCNTVPDGVVIFFIGEMDGPEHNLGSFGLAKETDRKPCSKWPITIAVPNMVIGGLHFGLSISEFIRIVGAPVHIEGKTAYAFFEGKRTMTKQEIQHLPAEAQSMIKAGQQQNYFDVGVSVVATFNDDGLHELRVWKTETF